MISFTCPECNKRLKALPEHAGQLTRCPYCRAVSTVPAELPEIEEPASPVVETKISPVAEAKNLTGVESTRTKNTEVKKKSREVSDDDEGEVPLSKPPKEINHEELIDMTAMVDIVFFLLIFFLVTSMSSVMSSAMLPRPEAHSEEGGGRSVTTDEPKGDTNEIIVKISKDDTIEIDGVPFRDIADLTARLHQLKNASGTESSLLIVGHGDASHGVAASILDAGYEVGINRLRLSVIDEEAE